MAYFSRNIKYVLNYSNCCRHPQLQTLSSCIVSYHSHPQTNHHGYHTSSRAPQTQSLVLRLSTRWQQLVRPPGILASTATGVRFNSTTSPSKLPDGYIPEPPKIPDGYIPEPPPLPAEQLTELAKEPVLNALGEPTLASLGLCNWTPPGFIQWALENMHVGLDLPWWGAIVTGTLFLRMCVFPLVIMGQRNTANMNNHMPTVQKLQEKMTRARAGGNALEAARIAVEMQDYMKRNKVNPLKGMVVPLCQIPIFVSVFFGLRTMANLPVQSLTTGGTLWFLDLTLPDPFYVLPILTMATFLATVELGVDGMSTSAMGRNMKFVMRAMPFIILPLIINFPTALCCYWFTSNLFSLSQVAILKIPAVKEFFQIPTIVKHEHAYDFKNQQPKKGFIQGFRESWSNQKMLANLEARQKADEVSFKDAGKSPLVKTYKHNPKAVQAKGKSDGSKS